MIILPSFQLATRLNSQNTNETEFIIELLRINMFKNIDISVPYKITDLQATETL